MSSLPCRVGPGGVFLCWQVVLLVCRVIQAVHASVRCSNGVEDITEVFASHLSACFDPVCCFSLASERVRVWVVVRNSVLFPGLRFCSVFYEVSFPSVCRCCSFVFSFPRSALGRGRGIGDLVFPSSCAASHREFSAG